MGWYSTYQKLSLHDIGIKGMSRARAVRICNIPTIGHISLMHITMYGGGVDLAGYTRSRLQRPHACSAAISVHWVTGGLKV